MDREGTLTVRTDEVTIVEKNSWKMVWK
jgi:hypothetical protein